MLVEARTQPRTQWCRPHNPSILTERETGAISTKPDFP